MDRLTERYIIAKRALFKKAMSDLNERQLEAVVTTEGPLLVIAGAGSGKTTVLVRRIAQIIKYGNAYYSETPPKDLSELTVAALEEALSYPSEYISPILDEFITSPCPPWNILAITFTNKAAKEMIERLGRIFDDEEISKSIWAGTFHAICMRIIRKYGQRLGYRNNATIYDTDDTKKLLVSIMKEMNIDEKSFTVKQVAGEISRAKEKLLGPDEYLRESKAGFREKVYAKIYAEYQARLFASNALDFDDIIMQTVRLLEEDEEVRQYYAGRFKYICVDEYQDTNHAQFRLCSLLASEWGNIMVVGDDDQSIYRFRGATIENILSFDKTYPSAKIVKLEQNYRSTKTILDAANAVISKNSERRKKVLWTNSEGGRNIQLEQLFDEKAEAKRVADIILGAVAAKKHSYRDFAVLYRVNAQSSTIERTFAKSAIPYRIYGGVRFADRKEIRDVVAYLQLINNTDDDIRLKRIINEPRRKIGEVTLNAVAAIASEEGISMFEVMRNANRYVALSRAAVLLINFTSMIEDLRRMLDDGCPLDAFVGHVLERSGYRQMLIDGGEEEKDRLDNVDEFTSSVIEYMKANEEPTLTGFLEETALVADVDRFDESADAVVLMTIHSAKGLEFPVAIIPGLEEGIFPGVQSLSDTRELEEERRLAYVAITRAKRELYLLCARQRMLYGRTSYNPISRFIEDIPDALVDKKLYSSDDGEFTVPVYQSLSPSGRTYFSSNTYSSRPVSNQGAHIASVEGTRPTSVGYSMTRPASKASTSTTQKTPSEIFEPGDRVRHATFGEGDVLSAKPMGSDMLYEVVFDDVGTKKLMGSYAKLKKA